MKFNRTQKIITIVAIVIFTWIEISYFYSFNFNPIGWMNFTKPSEDEIAKCIQDRELKRNSGTVGRIYGGKENDQNYCNPSQPQIISVQGRDVLSRKKSIKLVKIT